MSFRLDKSSVVRLGIRLRLGDVDVGVVGADFDFDVFASSLLSFSLLSASSGGAAIVEAREAGVGVRRCIPAVKGCAEA